MQTVKVSPKFQVVIPREIREGIGLKPGQTLQVFQFGDRIELIPVRPVREGQGMFPGIRTTVERGGDRY